MKTNIYFVRHAECETNVDPFFTGEVNGLTERGFAQAKIVANYFSSRNIFDIFTSDSLRAKLTAKEISNFYNKEAVILNSLKERDVVYTDQKNYLYKEDYNSFNQRLVEVKTFLQNLPEGDFVVISHAIFLKALMSYLLLEDFFTEELSSQISNQLIIDNVSISKFMFNKEKNKWQLDYINKKLV